MTPERRDHTYQDVVMDSLEQLIVRFDRIEAKLDALIKDLAEQGKGQASMTVEIDNLKERVKGLEDRNWKMFFGLLTSLAGLVTKILYDVLGKH